ncbi:MAG: Na/Pi cotransporter family protein [Clostridiales bacterium]|nr:Na/Pi cotransporter family protein [Clostridiales bacterium]
MDFFDVLSMLGGLALFLYGMETMGKGLAQASGGKLERILEKLTSNPLKAVLLGAGVTAVIQSSSATTVMVVGFVNSGIMKLTQAVGIIMGANIGTTVTSWILSLSGIESSNFFIRLLKPSSFSPVLALIGVCLLMFSKKEKKKDVGMIMIGFAILMTGMDTMSGAVKPLADVPEFTGILTMFSNPLLGMLCGAVLTAVIQSSSASVGILQALCATGAVSFGTAIPIIMGQNIGTCVTAVLSSIGAHKNAKRTALVHLYFNLIGTIIFMVAFYTVNSFVHFAFMGQPANAAGIAVVHSAFNVAATMVLLPFSKVLVKLACLTIPESAAEKEAENENARDFQLLDPRFLETPGYAVEQSRTVAIRMAELAKKALIQAIYLLENFNEELADKVVHLEDRVDKYEDQLGSYLVKLSAKNLSEKDSHTVSMLLHSIGDFERISDHAVNIVETAQELHQKNTGFSRKAQEEIRVLSKALLEIVESSYELFAEENYEKAAKIEPLEETIDYLSKQLKKRHVERLRTGECTIELGFALSDLTTNVERISDHCSNIAIALIQSRTDGYEAHEYTAELRRENNPKFKTEYEAYRDKYMLP